MKWIVVLSERAVPTSGHKVGPKVDDIAMVDLVCYDWFN